MVVVIFYIGYDMDDVMIINKLVYECGFGYGSIYKIKKISLKDDLRICSFKIIIKMFGFVLGSFIWVFDWEMFDEDGLFYVGWLVREGDIIVVWYIVLVDYLGKLVNWDGIMYWEWYKEVEDVFIEEVCVIGSDIGNEFF